MKFLIIDGERQSQLLAAITTCYERFKERDEQHTEELRGEGVIVCYSQWHLIYEMPLAAIRGAERVSFHEGILGPPPADDSAPYFFLLGDNYRRDLSRMLTKEGFAELGECIASAREVTLPEIHTFIDAEGGEYDVVGWDEADARDRAEREGRAKPPLRWNSSMCAFPSRGTAYRGKAESWDDPEPYWQPDEAHAGAEAEADREGRPAAVAAQDHRDEEDDSEKIPF